MQFTLKVLHACVCQIIASVEELKSELVFVFNSNQMYTTISIPNLSALSDPIRQLDVCTEVVTWENMERLSCFTLD